MMMQAGKAKKEVDMLNGPLWNKILLFALPLAASSILQQLFNAADIAVVGRYVGKNAMAAVGSNGSMINLLVNIFVGLSVGANVVISKYLGSQDVQRVRRAVHTSLLLAVFSGFLILTVGEMIVNPMLKLMSVPSEIVGLAALYLRIYFLGMPFMMLYNFSAAILRSKGDTKRPLFCLMLSGIVNVFLNLFFVRVCGRSVDGVAIATVASNVISSGLMLYFLFRETGPLRLEIKELRADRYILREVVQIGLPAGLQGVVFSFSNICIQSAMNKLGADVMAGSSAALNIEILVYYILSAFGQACVTFTGQNYGAGNHKRCVRVLLLCLGLGGICTLASSGLFVLFDEPLLRIFNSDPAVVANGVIRVSYVLKFQFLNMIIEIVSGSMRGMGYSMIPASICVAGVCGVRILWVYTVFARHPSFSVLMPVYPVSWIITAAGVIAAYLILKRKKLRV